MKIGTYYYPEQWPREQWERDFDKIASMGLQIVHMGEFAWYSMEPTQGDIQLDWLSDAVEMAAKRKLEVILCTPTCVPPVWLIDQFPEVLLENEHGTHTRHGGRRHYNPCSLRMLEATHRIVTALGDRFGNHPSLMGWQIDNELSAPFDQSEQTHKAFRVWLEKKYLTIDALNIAWGNQFWNTYYQSFEQIMFPPGREPRYGNPHQHLDASRFWSRAFADFTKTQSDILTPRSPGKFVTTNFMPFCQDVDPADFKDSLNLWTWDTYPMSGQGRDFKNENYRLADPTGMQFIHDQMASYNGRWALMEVQPGQINWSGYPVLPYPGAIRLWLWTAIAHNCEFITVYRFRMPRFGIEMWHDGLVNHDGVTMSPGGKQFQQVASEWKRVAAAMSENSEPVVKKISAPKKSELPTVGILFDFDQLWYYNSLPQAKKWSQTHLLLAWYEAAIRLGYHVKVIRPEQHWPSDLQIIVAPGLQMVDDPVLKKLHGYVEKGGHLVLTCRTAIMDKTGQFFEAPRGEPIHKLIGASIEAYDSLPEDTYGHIDMDDHTKHKWTVWGDLLYPEDGTRTWATYSDQFYAGSAAITHKKHPKGTVTYCGIFTDSATAGAVMQRLAKALDLPANPLPDRVRIVKRDGLNFALNYTDKPQKITIPPGAKILIGKPDLEPAGVAIWQDT